MGHAFSISVEDLQNVVNEFFSNYDIDDVKLNELFDELDHHAIEEAALTEDDLEAQTNAAYVDIAEQLQILLDT